MVPKQFVLRSKGVEFDPFRIETKKTPVADTCYAGTEPQGSSGVGLSIPVPAMRGPVFPIPSFILYCMTLKKYIGVPYKSLVYSLSILPPSAKWVEFDPIRM